VRHEVINHELHPDTPHPSVYLALEWFEHWKKDVQAYWRIRDVVISRSARGDQMACLIEDVFQKLERREVILDREILGAFWVLRELTEALIPSRQVEAT